MTTLEKAEALLPQLAEKEKDILLLRIYKLRKAWQLGGRRW